MKKMSRLGDWWIVCVFCKARAKLGNAGCTQRAPVGGSRPLLRSVEPRCQSSWGTFTPLHIHTDFAMPFKENCLISNTPKGSGAEF